MNVNKDKLKIRIREEDKMRTLPLVIIYGSIHTFVITITVFQPGYSPDLPLVKFCDAVL